MTSEKKGIDLSSITENNEPKEEPIPCDNSTEQATSVDELLSQLNESDPLVAMIAAQIFDQGNLVRELIRKVTSLEKHVGYLLSNDDEFMKKVKAQTEQNSEGLSE